MATAPLAESYQDLSDWYQTPLGRQWQQMQMQWVNEEIGCLFGYHLMQVGINTGDHFCQQSRINHCFNVMPVVAKKDQDAANINADNNIKVKGCLLAQAQNLPLPDDCIDVTILHHALDFAQNPHQVLKEATRVTVPRGYIILIGFNPGSFWGVYQIFARFFSSKSIYKHNRLRLGRVKDWLALLDFSTVKSGSKGHSLPINNENYISRKRGVSRQFWGMNLPLGNIYFILARKDKSGITPIKPSWNDKTFLGATALPKQAVSARVKNHYADVLPLRKRNKTKP